MSSNQPLSSTPLRSEYCWAYGNIHTLWHILNTVSSTAQHSYRHDLLTPPISIINCWSGDMGLHWNGSPTVRSKVIFTGPKYSEVIAEFRKKYVIHNATRIRYSSVSSPPPHRHSKDTTALKPHNIATGASPRVNTLLSLEKILYLRNIQTCELRFLAEPETAQSLILYSNFRHRKCIVN